MSFKSEINESVINAIKAAANLAKVDFDNEAVSKVLAVIEHFNQLDQLQLDDEPEFFYPTSDALFTLSEDYQNVDRDIMLQIVPDRLGLFIKSPLVIGSKDDA
mgnify:CR=1 FL=1